MSRPDALDAAFGRSRILMAVVVQARERAKANPLDGRWEDCGLTAEGDTKSEAAAKINRGFDELVQFVTYISILDMSASFERVSRSKISNMIGELRKRAKGGGKIQKMPDASSGLIKALENFEGLAPIYTLIEAYAGIELKDQFEAIRDARNKVSHGNVGTSPPKIEVEDARKALTDLIDLLSE